MQHGVARGRLLQQVFAGKKGRRNLAEMPVERGDVIDRLSADVTLAEQLRHEKSRRQMSQVAVFGRLVEQGVAQFGLVRDHLRSEQAGGQLPEVTVGRARWKTL